MSGERVELEHVSKRYAEGDKGIVALDDVSLTIEVSEVLAVSGPSGSGKSTLLHVIGAMDRVDSGTIRVGQREITSFAEKQLVSYRRTIGFVFQRFHLLPALTVRDNVMAPVMPYRTAFDKDERALELLRAVGLADRADSLPSRLSGGQQQRVAIARALVNEPVLVLADEPTGNLDSETGAEIVDLLLGLRDQLGTTILVATHDAGVAGTADRVVRLRDGAVVP